MTGELVKPVSEDSADMFRPPINRAMRVLDKSFFKKDVSLSAARIFDSSHISRVRGQLEKSKDMLVQRLMIPIRKDPSSDVPNRKCILLRPEIRHDDRSTWSDAVRQLNDSGDVALIPFDMQLDYDYWTAQEILAAILPEELHDDLPHRFNPAGHIAHFNLREPYLPYKSLIGNIIISKNPTITTVVNKTEQLDTLNTFRVLPFELLAGVPNYDVRLREHGTTFHFDFSKVFWNSRLETEHASLVARFKPGEAVCDVMAGVGPFAVPAGRKGVFVYANDLNPDCYSGLSKSIALNKVEQFVKPFQVDGNDFIKSATSALLNKPPVARLAPKASSRRSNTSANQSRSPICPEPNSPSLSQLRRSPPPPGERAKTIYAPRTFSHYVMNLPATALSFLPSFKGTYAGHEELFHPHTSTRLPIVHCYCFGPKVDMDSGWTREKVDADVVKQVEEQLGVSMWVDASSSAGNEEKSDSEPVSPARMGEGNGQGKFSNAIADEPESGKGMVANAGGHWKCEVRDVRDVAPNKQEICVSFRLPKVVAFAKT